MASQDAAAPTLRFQLGGWVGARFCEPAVGDAGDTTAGAV